MDHRTDSPWSWEEEIQWKADLEERDENFLEELIENAVEESVTDSLYFLGAPLEQRNEDATEEYLVTV